MKKCRVCEEEKPESEYSPSRKGFRKDCKSCHNAASRRSLLKAKLNRQLAKSETGYDVDALAAQYGKNKLWVAQGLKACRISKVSEEYFVGRYLKREGDIIKNQEVEDAFKAIRGILL